MLLLTFVQHATCYHTVVYRLWPNEAVCMSQILWIDSFFGVERTD